MREGPTTADASTEGLRLYVLPDIHGRLDALEKALSRIDTDWQQCQRPTSTIVCLGDYVDRGAQSAEVIERLTELKRSRPIICLRGNHERLMLDALDDPDRLGAWLKVGGDATLISYRIDPRGRRGKDAAAGTVRALRDTMPAHHLEFLNGLASSWTCGSYFFAHAGVRPGVPFAQQTEDDLLWIRKEFLESDLDHGGRVVHGHTVVSAPDVRSNRINLDTGAYATGRLSCLILDEGELGFL